MAFSPQGTGVVTGAKDSEKKNAAMVWDVSTGAAIQSLDAHTDWMRGVAASADGATVVTVGDERRGIVWGAQASASLCVTEWMWLDWHCIDSRGRR